MALIAVLPSKKAVRHNDLEAFTDRVNDFELGESLRFMSKALGIDHRRALR